MSDPSPGEPVRTPALASTPPTSDAAVTKSVDLSGRETAAATKESRLPSADQAVGDTRSFDLRASGLAGRDAAQPVGHQEKDSRAAPDDGAAGPVLAPAPGADAVGPDVPAFGRIPYDLQKSVGPLNLDAHVYTENAQRRFAMINGRFVSEGDEVSSGLSVVRIIPEGVVLKKNGKRFLLAIGE
ncbi:MAG: general secretion pathway protein GspB [Pseudomonadota bacterium]